MNFLRENWFFILVLLLMIGCHLLPGHGGHEEHDKDEKGGRR